jgi:hypothetical protein
MQRKHGGNMNTWTTRKFFAVLFVLILGASTNSIAAENEIYRWVDDNQVVHYTQKPPANRAFTRLDHSGLQKGIQSTAPPPVRTPEHTNVIDTTARSAAQVASAAQSEEELALACQQAQDNLDKLGGVPRILVTEGDGEVRRLPEEERLEWLDRSEKFLKENCQ